MILTTPTKQPYTTTKHNHKSYIFTLYLFMFLCVVGNCLLFYCSCTGNCENCCRINGSIKDKSESEINNVNNDNKKKEEKKEDDKIEIKYKIDIKNKLEEVAISDYGEIGNIQIVNAKFVNLVNVHKYTGSSDNYERAKKEFLNNIKPTGETTYLSAYVEVKNNGIVKLRCFIYCTNANSKSYRDIFYYGLFHGSAATKIVILSCGSEIKDMNCMFNDCSSLKELDLSKFTTENVTNMRNMFSGCSSLTILDLSKLKTVNVTYMSFMFYKCSSLNNLDLSKFNTTNVTNMSYMFSGCSSLTELDLSNFNTENVTNMRGMFYNCFKEKRQPSTLICKASTIRKITDNGDDSCLIIPDEKNDWIKNTLKNNLKQVYTCSIERVEDNPKIIDVKEKKK